MIGFARIPAVVLARETVITADSAVLPVPLADMKSHLRIDAADTAFDAKLTLVINAVSNFFECFTGTTLITKTYTDFHDCLVDRQVIELVRSKVSTVNSVQYLSADVLTAFDATKYRTTKSSKISKICLKPDVVWPAADNVCQAWEVSYDAGFGAADTDIPEEVKESLMHHAANIFVNTGDCGDCDSQCASSLDSFSKSIYNKYRIMRIRSC